MENKTKILTFAAVALMFAVCFIGFVAINDGEVDAEGTTTNVAKIGETPYPTLIDAIKNVKNGETITLVRDVTDGSGVGIFVNSDGYIVYNATTHAKEDMALKKGGKLTLDLNGKTYCVTTPAVGSKGYETQAFHLEMGFNVTIKNGTITSSGSSVKMLVQNYCNLTLDNVTLDGSNLPGAKGYVLSNNFGNITITGNTQIIAPSNGVAFDLWYGMSSSYDNGVFVTFDEKFTGIVNGTIEYGADADRVTNGNLTNKAVLKINGSGTFKGDLKFSSNQITVADIKISSGSFTDIANAVKYATSGATITLAENVTLSSSIVVTKLVTIDLNGKAITSFTRVFKILANDVIFTINANGGSISTTDTVVFTYDGYANPNVIVNGGTYSGNYVFVNYAQCGSFSIDKANVNGKSAGIWFGSGPTSEASITDSTIVATGMGIYLGTVKEATLSNVKVTGGTGIEIKSGTVTIDGKSTITGTANYEEDLDMNNNGSGGSVAAICINNVYVDKICTGVSRIDGVFVTIGKDVSIVSKNADEKKICITSGYKHDSTVSVDNAPIFVNSGLDKGKVGVLCRENVVSPVIYNGVARVINDHMYDMIKDDSRVDSYLIESENDDVSLKNLKGSIILNTDKNVIISELTNNISVKGKVGALTITGSGDESVSIELDSAETLCISNVKDVTVNGGKFESDSYVDANGGNFVVNISNVKETVSVKNVTINAKGDVKGQGISIMNCTEVKRIVISDNKIYNAGHHSIMIGSVFAKLETMDITNNLFSEWGYTVGYSSAIHMFGKGGSDVVATISNNTFGCVMKDSSRLGKIISIGYQNGNNNVDDVNYIGTFKNPVLFTKNVVNGKATDDFELVVEEKATTYLDFGTKYAGNAIDPSVRQDGINHKAISYGDFTIVSTDGKMMDIGNNGSIVINGTVTCEGTIKTTATDKLDIKGKLVMKAGSTLTVGSAKIIGAGAFDLKTGELEINTNSKGGFDATLNGKATASKLDVWINDTFTVAKGAELTMTGTFLNAGNVTIDGTLLMTDAGKLQVMKNGIVTINGTIDGGIIDITNVDKDVVCVLFKPNSTITSKIDGTDDGKTSIVVLFGIKAGKGGVSVTKGSVIVDGALVEGDVTVPSGSTSFVYGTLEPGATLTIENNAAVNPTGSGSLVVESGAKVVTNSGASIKSVTYKAGSELNGTTFDTDTRVTPEGNVLVAIKIYLNYDNKKLNVSADYVEAFAGDKYVDVLSGVSVSGINSRITFSGWYNSLDEKITSDVVVPSGGADVILTAHFTEKAKNTVVNTGSNDGVDYSVVIAFIVLIGSIVFLCSVLRKR